MVIFSLRFDLGLEKFGVAVEELKEPAKRRIFRAWLEDWEKDNLTKQDAVVEALFMEKYKNLEFIDFDDAKKTVYKIWDRNLEYHKKNRKRGIEAGWGVVYLPKDDPDGEPEGWQIGEDLIDSISKTPQADGVEIIHLESGGKEAAGEDSSSNDDNDDIV